MKPLQISVLVVASLWLLACGAPAADSQSSLLDGAASNSSASFTGLWTGNGTLATTIQSSSGPTNDTEQIASDSVTIVKGASSDIVVAWQGCNLPGTVNQQVATLNNGYTCTENNGTATITLNFTTGTATAVQNVVSLNASGNLAVTEGGQTINGTFTLQEQLTKVGDQ